MVIRAWITLCHRVVWHCACEGRHFSCVCFCFVFQRQILSLCLNGTSQSIWHSYMVFLDVMVSRTLCFYGFHPISTRQFSVSLTNAPFAPCPLIVGISLQTYSLNDLIGCHSFYIKYMPSNPEFISPVQSLNYRQQYTADWLFHFDA